MQYTGERERGASELRGKHGHNRLIHSTRSSSVVLRECPEGIREFP
jgi:hypothetical protein